MAQKINREVWLSADGKKEFETEADCRAYDARTRWQSLVTDMQNTIDVSGYQTERAAKASLTRLESGALLMLGYLSERGLLAPQAEQYAAQLTTLAPPPVAAAA